MNHTLRVCGAIAFQATALLSLLNHASALADGRASDGQRWAVINGPDPATEKLSTLLTIDLSQVPGIQVVERTNLQSALRELTLSSQQIEADPAQRLRLGQLVKADGLVVLHADTDPTPAVRVILCDTVLGARLRSDRFELNGLPLEAMATQITKEIEQTQSAFPRGVQVVLGVPQFFSRDLSQQFDRWQSVFACVLGNALSSYSGTAVLEIEEARAIERELKISAGHVANDLRFLYVEGDYRAQDGPDKKVRLRVGLRAGNGEVHQFEHESDDLASAAGWLRSEVAPGVMNLLAKAPLQPLSVQQQVEWLKERASSFSRLGDSVTAVSLLDTALLLLPLEAELCRAILDECQVAVERRPAPAWDSISERQPTSIEIREEWRRRLGLWRRGLEVLSARIGHHAVSQTEALEELAKLRRSFEMFLLYAPRAGRLSPWSPTELQVLEEEIARCSEADLEFRRQEFPAIVALDVGTSRPVTRYVPGGHVLMEGADSSAGQPRVYRNRRDLVNFALDLPLDSNRAPIAVQRLQLPHFQKVLLDPTVPETPTDRVTQFIAHAATGSNGISGEKFSAFLDALRASQRPLNRYYAEFGRILADAANAGGNPGVLKKSAAALNALLLDFEKSALFVERNDLSLAIRNAITNTLLRLEPHQESAAGPPSAGKPSTSEPSPADLHSDPPGVVVRATKLEMKVRRLNGQLEKIAGESENAGDYVQSAGYPVWSASIGDKSDLFCNNWTVWIHREPGVLQELSRDYNAEYEDSVSDGENYWVASLRRGISVYSPTGTLVRHIDGSDGLPEADRRLKLAPIGPGRVLAAGSFGPQKRAWVAVVALEGQKVTTDIFFEARQTLPPMERNRLTLEVPDMTFDVCCIQKWCSALGDGRSLFLINREEFKGFPLLVDPADRTVRVQNVNIGPRDKGAIDGHFLYLENGDAIRAKDNRIWHTTQLNCLGSDGCLERAIFERDKAAFTAPPFYVRGYIYFPGKPWVRVAADSLAAETIQPDPLESFSLSSKPQFFRSALLGPICWDDAATFLQLEIRDAASTADRITGQRQVAVVDAETGAPISGANFWLVGEGWKVNGATDDAGSARVTFDSGPAGLIVASAYKIGWIADIQLIRRRAAFTGPDQTLIFKLKKACRIGGRLEDERGRALPGRDVSALVYPSKLNSFPLEISSPVHTDENGRWNTVLAGVDPRKLALSATARGGTEPEHRLESLKPRQVEGLLAGDFVWTIENTPASIGPGPGNRAAEPATRPTLDRLGAAASPVGPVIHETASLPGRLIGPEGAPVSGAAIEQRTAGPNGMSLRKVTSDTQGRFQLPALQGQTTLLIVRHPNFGLLTEWWLDDSSGTEKSLKLAPRMLIHGRVVDQRERPIEGAVVSFENWSVAGDCIWSMKTDAEGRFDFPEAPAGEKLTFSVRPTSASRSGRPETVAPSKSGEVVLHLARKREFDVGGVVTDAATGAPISAFNAEGGNESSLEKSLIWSGQLAPKFADGEFRLRFNGDGVPAIRVLASGYLPEIRTIDADEAGVAAIELALHRGDRLHGVLLMPEGVPTPPPAANQRITMATSTNDATVINDRHDGVGFGQTVKTDMNGAFSFPAQTCDFFLYVDSADGFLQLGPIQNTDSNLFQLQRWGRIAGVCRAGLNGGAEEIITWESIPIEMAACALHKRGETQTDAQGHFSFDNVPPGQVALHRAYRIGSHGSYTTYNHNSQTLTVASGEERQIVMASSAATLTGRLVITGSTSSDIEEYSLTGELVGIPPDRHPPNWSQMTAKERKLWEATAYTPQEQAERRAIWARRLVPEISADGRFVIDDAPSGRYSLKIKAYDKSHQALPMKPLPVEVPEPDEKKAGTVDLGVIRLERGDAR